MTARHAQPGHRHVDHTGDVAVELWAPTEEALLREGALATAEILTGRDGASIGAPPAEHHTVRLETLDREDRLVQWLNEVIFLAVYQGLLVVDADIEIEDRPGHRMEDQPGGVLIARVRAAPIGPEELDTELKSATYHDLRVQQDHDGAWRARVVIDV